MKRERLVAQAIADVMLAGTQDVAGYVLRTVHLFGTRHRWIRPLCRRTFQRFGSSLEERDRSRLVDWICDDAGYRAAWQAGRPPRIARYPLDPPRMSPRRGALAACALPDLATPGDLARWLDLTPGELDWFADTRGMNPAEGPLGHYRYRWVSKRFGMRLIEAPKQRLRSIQQRILRGLLDQVPAHFAAHGFRRGRSCASYALPHVGCDIVLRMDLCDFFASIPATRIHSLFGMLGYPDPVARLLAALCTNVVPMSIARGGSASWADAKRLGVPHLPQGAPTSPALANLCALHLDLRLAELAKSMEGRYTRYADDLAISGAEALRRSVDKVLMLVARIAAEEGFAINHRKTRRMHRSRRQVLAGVVVNEKLNVPRPEFDRLKAVISNCLRDGPSAQNRDGVSDFQAHLRGRIAHVARLNRARGEKLLERFARIDWGR